MFCRLAPRLEGRARNFCKSQGLYIGRKLYTTTRYSLRFDRCFALLGPRTCSIGLILPSPKGYRVGQSLYRGRAWNIYKYQSLYREGDLRIFASPRIYLVGWGEYSLIFSTYFFIFPTYFLIYRGGAARNFSESSQFSKSNSPFIGGGGT